MTLTDDDFPLTAPCVNHPRRETALRCGKCDSPICTACIVQTPVGARCRNCAQMRRLPQFDVGPVLLARSGLGGLVASLVSWLVISYVPYLRLFLSVLVGVAVGTSMSRLARRRSNRWLDIIAVVVVAVGLLVVYALRFPSTLRLATSNQVGGTGQLAVLVLSVALASFVAVSRLR